MAIAVSTTRSAGSSISPKNALGRIVRKPEQAASAAMVMAAGGTAKATYRSGVSSSGLS